MTPSIAKNIHNESFDVAVFLNLQKQESTWTCLVCGKPAAQDTLVFDQFFQQTLQSTRSDVEQVTVGPDGSWRLLKTDNDKRDPRDPSNPFTKPEHMLRRVFVDSVGIRLADC